MTLQTIRRDETDANERPRFGLTVTKKVGNAVERNRIRRRFREALRAPGLVPSPGHDYVIVARRESLTLPFADLVSELTGAFERQRAGRARGKPRATARPAGDRDRARND